jgi:two-component system, chemotaxis family, chemotaxis protein CheY
MHVAPDPFQLFPTPADSQQPGVGLVTEPVKTVLVVDDSPGVRQMLRFTFEGEGLAVIDAPDGPAALAEARKCPTLVAIYSDVNMPGMSGLELLAALKAQDETKHVPVILISALVDPSIVTKARSLGALGWISKPLTPEALLSTIRKLLKRSVQP